MDFPVWVLKGDVGVRVDDAGHAQVLVDALSSALVLGLHATGDFQAVFLEGAVGQFPDFPVLVGFRGLVFPSVQTDVHHGGGGFGSDF